MAFGWISLAITLVWFLYMFQPFYLKTHESSFPPNSVELGSKRQGLDLAKSRELAGFGEAQLPVLFWGLGHRWWFLVLNFPRKLWCFLGGTLPICLLCTKTWNNYCHPVGSGKFGWILKLWCLAISKSCNKEKEVSLWGPQWSVCQLPTKASRFLRSIYSHLNEKGGYRRHVMPFGASLKTGIGHTAKRNRLRLPIIECIMVTPFHPDWSYKAFQGGGLKSMFINL